MLNLVSSEGSHIHCYTSTNDSRDCPTTEMSLALMNQDVNNKEVGNLSQCWQTGKIQSTSKGRFRATRRFVDLGFDFNLTCVSSPSLAHGLTKALTWLKCKNMVKNLTSLPWWNYQTKKVNSNNLEMNNYQHFWERNLRWTRGQYMLPFWKFN